MLGRVQELSPRRGLATLYVLAQWSSLLGGDSQQKCEWSSIPAKVDAFNRACCPEQAVPAMTGSQLSTCKFSKYLRHCNLDCAAALFGLDACLPILNEMFGE